MSTDNDAPVRIVLDQYGEAWTLCVHYDACYQAAVSPAVLYERTPAEPEADAPTIVEGK